MAMNEFTGVTARDLLPVFPLPDFVLFPGISTPLHIFEPRYRRMLTSVLDGKGLICMATLQGDWKKVYHEKTPEIFPIGCICRVMDYSRLDDGRYNVIVEGRRKARIIEVPSSREYRCAHVEVLEFQGSAEIDPGVEARARAVASSVLLKEGEAPPEMREHMNKLSLDALANVMCFHYPGSVRRKLALLELNTYRTLFARLIEFYEPLASK
jgi:uncharacterized protein